MTLHQRFFPFFFAETFLTSLLHRKMFLGEKETAVRLLMPIKFTTDLFVSSIRSCTQLEQEMIDTCLGKSSLYHMITSLIKKKPCWKFQINGLKEKKFFVRVLSFLDRKCMYLLYGQYMKYLYVRVTFRYRELEKE